MTSTDTLDRHRSLTATFRRYVALHVVGNSADRDGDPWS